MDQLKIVRVDEEHRYVAQLDGQLVGFVRYRTRPGSIVASHTEISDDFEGRGLGSALVRATLDDIRARGEKIVPLCPFIASYITRHPDYADLVAPDDSASAVAPPTH